MTSWHGGKGPDRRPAAVDEQTIADNWARIFGPKPCPCGESTCTQSWQPGCGLGLKNAFTEETR